VGLINIQTRASLFNGTTEIISSPGQGTELVVVFS
jgi:signal transduction histidine kinase